MNFVKIKISELTPYEGNAKIHTKEQIEQIKNSIELFGMNDPIGVWGEKNIIVEGHGRIEALKQLGYEEVYCIRLDHLTDEERRAYTLAHNKLTMNTDNDFQKLYEELNKIETINMEDFGFVLSFENESESKERKDLSDEVVETFEVIVECANELEQEEVFNKLSKEGLKCRVLTL